MRRHNCHEEIEVYGAADLVCAEAGGDGSCGRGSVPEVGDQRGNFLQLEEEVRRAWDGGVKTSENFVPIRRISFSDALPTR